MGGQFDFFGLWIDSEYGKGRCAPSCSSYTSPQLSKEEHFEIEHMEVRSFSITIKFFLPKSCIQYIIVLF